ncbi:hypothetical protein RvY_17670 [Ramazzottius varieornatus]|uniref:C2H2-type domain-containing protein n=1 Tax=Ramazzottius varieornatus TaxID=947166 RepID=A0A1D1W2Y5_RAMVA|nr:hypothetical protein RvY_17670 [Ramazzottius varieornatus]
MSKLGAICDKLRLGGAPSSPPHHTSSPKREPSPPPVYTPSTNKRKNFRPVSLNDRNSTNLQPVESTLQQPSTFVSELASVTTKTTSVIVRAPTKEDRSKTDERFEPDREESTSEPTSPPESAEEPSRYVFRGPPSFDQRQAQLRQDLYNASISSNSSSFYQTQVFPFMDYRNFPSNDHDRKHKRRNTYERNGGEEDTDGSVNYNDSDDGKLTNGGLRDVDVAGDPGLLQEPEVPHDGKTAVNRRSRKNNTLHLGGTKGSGKFKWSGVRNSIRSLDIWQYVRQGNETCQSAECRNLGLKEHYHCKSCPNKVIFRKEEMIRHVKWHKKRDETMQLGFLRFSGNDDCSNQFGACPHAGRQTHYHCLMKPCTKVYTSTSDVQMHAALHRKEIAIKKEGFQRYRAVDDCGDIQCTFARTTHFHCIRSDCTFTFRNKADMEKHKAYHAKNDELAKDGFRKFMKYEHCRFDTCPYSKIMNHIHCLKPGCRYVFTSSAQLQAHKRKHDKSDFFQSNAFDRELKPQQQPTYSYGSSDEEEDSPSPRPNLLQSSMSCSYSSDELDNGGSDSEEPYNSDVGHCVYEKGPIDQVMFNPPVIRGAEAANMLQSHHFHNGHYQHINRPSVLPQDRDRKNMSLLHSALQLDNGQATPFAERPSSSPHMATPKIYPLFPTEVLSSTRCDANNPTCKPSGSSLNLLMPSASTMATSYPPFKRKRGRPPKNPVIDVHVFPSTPNASHNQAMFSSFKLGKGGVLMDIRQESASAQQQRQTFTVFPNGPSERVRQVLPKLSQAVGGDLPEKSPTCQYGSCVYAGRDHYHCTHPRCHFASERDDILVLHIREFHTNIDIMEGYEFFDQSVDCDLAGCASNRLTRHFHCMRPGCLYSFVRYDTMATHEEKHRLAGTSSSSTFPSATPPAEDPPHPPPPSPPPTMLERSPLRPEPRMEVEPTQHRPVTIVKPEEFQEGRFFCHPMLSKMHYFPQKPCVHLNSCRLSEREHFHCDRCDFAYTSPLRLQNHLRKCDVQRPQEPTPSSSPRPLLPKYPLNLLASAVGSPSVRYPSAYQNSIASSDSEQYDTKDSSQANQSTSKKLKFVTVGAPGQRNSGTQRQPIPEGFQRFLCTETCDWPECVLSGKQTHWHCTDQDCRQFFSDKTRLERHTERHRRLAAIIGNDFRRYSAKVSCGDLNCTLKNSSHVHCLQCDSFVCTETAKIATHRRSHLKQDAVAAAGFDKYSFRTPCPITSCLYHNQTHYHCTRCKSVVKLVLLNTVQFHRDIFSCSTMMVLCGCSTMSQMQAHQSKHETSFPSPRFNFSQLKTELGDSADDGDIDIESV